MWVKNTITQWEQMSLFTKCGNLDKITLPLISLVAVSFLQVVQFGLSSVFNEGSLTKGFWRILILWK